jgi:hypothetical protein
MSRDTFMAPGEFPVGSLESRAAARAMLGRCNVTTVIISTGFPDLSGEKLIVNPPDNVTYYLAPDDSIVEVICRGYAPGTFTANIHQAWDGGRDYHGNHLVTGFADLENFCRPQRPRRQDAS